MVRYLLGISVAFIATPVFAQAAYCPALNACRSQAQICNTPGGGLFDQHRQQCQAEQTRCEDRARAQCTGTSTSEPMSSLRPQPRTTRPQPSRPLPAPVLRSPSGLPWLGQKPVPVAASRSFADGRYLVLENPCPVTLAYQITEWRATGPGRIINFSVSPRSAAWWFGEYAPYPDNFATTATRFYSYPDATAWNIRISTKSSEWVTYPEYYLKSLNGVPFAALNQPSSYGPPSNWMITPNCAVVNRGRFAP